MTALDGQGRQYPKHFDGGCSFQHMGITISGGTRASGNHWEYYERDGWKQCSELINRFLEEQSLLGVETCQLTSSADDEKYEWNFPALTQTRMHRRHRQWVRVKTRSIRLATVQAAPARPVDCTSSSSGSKKPRKQ